MNSEECETQLNSLIEHFNYGSTDINATDIEAIKHLLSENQMQHNEIINFIKRQENFIKYLEDKIKFIEQPREYKDSFGYGAYTAYIDILERIKNNNYE